jgi:hypothetical protein
MENINNSCQGKFGLVLLAYKELGWSHTTLLRMDRLIATYFIENNHELLHNDSDFDPNEQYLGFRVIHPG